MPELFTRTAAETAYWPLRMWADRGIAGVECGECSSGVLLVASEADRPFVITDLIVRLEAHISTCSRRRG